MEFLDSFVDRETLLPIAFLFLPCAPYGKLFNDPRPRLNAGAGMMPRNANCRWSENC